VALEFVLVLVLLVAARILLDLLSVLTFALSDRPAFDHPILAFVVGALGVVASLLVALSLAITRIRQRRFLGGIVFLGLCAIPFLIPRFLDGPYWKFWSHKNDYLMVPQSDVSPFPRYNVFDWGNRNTSLGGGVLFEAIVYDESDEIARSPDARSQEWNERRSTSPPMLRWISDLSVAPNCHRSIRTFGEHFYYALMVCV